MTWVQIPLDMDFSYLTVHGLSCTAETFNLNLPAAHYNTNHVDRGKKLKAVIRMPIENKTKPLITATR